MINLWFIRYEIVYALFAIINLSQTLRDIMLYYLILILMIIALQI